MARSTMDDLITRLRGLTQAGTADYTIAGVTYHSDDHLQEALDDNRLDIYRERLSYVREYVGGGTAEYKVYAGKWGNFEKTDGGTAIFFVADTDGDNIGTALYSVDYQRGVITFDADQGGTARYLTARSYDLYGAAADVWSMKAAHYSITSFDFSTDNHSVKRSQLKTQAHEMSRYYASMARAQVSTMIRTDIDSEGYL
jgi:hypothetical protein